MDMRNSDLKPNARRVMAVGATFAGLFWLNPVLGSGVAAVPDFATNSNVGWVASGFGFGTDFVQPASGPGPVTNDPRYPYVTNVDAARTGKQPTFRVADLNNPILQPWVAEQMKKANDDVLAGKVAFTADSRCFPSGVPSFLLFPANPVRFVQTAKEVLMVWQQNQETRRVYLDVPHSVNPKPSWYGESVGHYENGDTLVVDTIGMNDRTYVDNYLTPHTTRLHVVERFKLTEGSAGHPSATTAEDVPRFKPTEGGKALEVA